MTTTLDRSDASGARRLPAAAGLARSKAVWAVVITGLALFMASLDNLVVSTALPVIRVNLHAGLSGLEWTVNAYTLTFAVLLLSAAAMGERFGRRRIFIIGIAVFTLASAAAALAPSIGVLVAARAVQGAGGAMIMPLSLTLLSAAVPPERRNAALGIWGAIGGMAVAIGPLVGGAVTTGWAWQYIFWLNVPIGLILVPLAWWKLSESRVRASRLDVGGVLLASIGLFGVVYGLVQGNSHGWTSTGVLTSFLVGIAGLAAFVWWELRVESPDAAAAPVQEPGLRRRQRDGHAVQLRDVRLDLLPVPVPPDRPGLLPASAGIRVLPWTGVTMLLAPVVGLLAERFGGKVLVVTGLVFQALGLFWLATIVTPTTPYLDMVPAFVIAGVGMTLFFVPLASLVLGSVPKALEGVASGTNSAFRELGGVLGIAVLGAVFSSSGGYSSGQSYVNGLTPAITVGAVVVAIGAVTAMLVPAVRRSRQRKDALSLEGAGLAGEGAMVDGLTPIGDPDWRRVGERFGRWHGQRARTRPGLHGRRAWLTGATARALSASTKARRARDPRGPGPSGGREPGPVQP